VSIRAASDADIPAVAQIWYDGWHDGHAAICPAELTALRTIESFLDRAKSHLSQAMVAVQGGEVIGFYMLQGAEVYQFYVASAGRGTGVAKQLMLDAEDQFRADGGDIAWLACSIGNDRAARFYEKTGWVRTGTVIEQLEVSTGTFPLEVWRYEKGLT
jgi:ribosomal protein S18 acetylase RimI-like enzyme